MTILPDISTRPQLFFFTELGDGLALREMLRPATLDALVACGAGVAMALTSLDDVRAETARLLAARGIRLVAWLCLPSGEGFALNLSNYPRAADSYQAMRSWAAAEGLHFNAIGLAIEPPSDGSEWSTWRALRGFARGLWLARDNALEPAARSAYLDLIATMRHDGYEVHTYQLPFVADDRRAGTTLVQRALDILDLAADVDVLMCGSDVPIDWLDGDLGGALVESYGPVADAIAVGAVDIADTPGDPALPWAALRRDLLLAAQHTDTIYVASLEHCVRAGLLPGIAALDWEAPARAGAGRRALIGALRTLLLSVLLVARHGQSMLAWAGWALALALWLRGRRRQ
jgi:hypothetical protein